MCSCDNYLDYVPMRLSCSSNMFEDTWEYSKTIPNTPNPLNPRYMIRRKQCTFGATYLFGGQVSKCVEYENWPELVKYVLDDVRKHSGSDVYNVVHTNWYPNGKAGLDPHADDERDMISNMDIYSYTFLSDVNKPRGFQIYTYEDLKHPVKEIMLGHGDLLIMKTGMQKEYKHGVKKSAAKKYDTLRRINMTVRVWKSQCE